MAGAVGAAITWTDPAPPCHPGGTSEAVGGCVAAVDKSVVYAVGGMSEEEADRINSLKVLPYRVIVYDKDDKILYDRVLDDQQLWLQAPGLYTKIRDDRNEGQ